MTKLFVLSILLLSASFARAAGEPVNIAVADFDGKNVSAADASAISDFFRSALVNTKTYVVLDRSNMEMLLAEQQYQMSGCTEQGCAVKLGKILNVQKMIVGTVSLFDQTYYINAQVIDVEKGVIETSEKTSTMVKNELPAKAEALAQKISKKEKQPEAASAPKEIPSTSATFFKFSLWPGADIPNKNVVKGVGIGFLGSRDNVVEGINVCYFYSRFDQKMSGISFALYNDVRGTMKGIELGAIANANTFYGIQYGFCSRAETTYGVQVGWINVATKMNGLQFGLLNYTQYIKGVQLGLLNIATKNTLLPGMVFVNVGF